MAHAQKVFAEAGCLSEKDAKCFDNVIKTEMDKLYFHKTKIRSNEQHLYGNPTMRYENEHVEKLKRFEETNKIHLALKNASLREAIEKCHRNKACPGSNFNDF